jgi:hypothetical protein
MTTRRLLKKLMVKKKIKAPTRIILEVIPHEQQRLDALGDWFFTQEGNLTVRVSDLGDWRYNFLVLRHEMDEAILCMHNGITTEMVDEDQAKLLPTDDPDSYSGFPGARLQNQHNDALAAEWQMSRLLSVNWESYGKASDKVGKWS